MDIIINLKKQLYKLEIINRTDINPEEYIIEEVILKLDLKKYSKKIILNVMK